MKKSKQSKKYFVKIERDDSWSMCEFTTKTKALKAYSEFFYDIISMTKTEIKKSKINYISVNSPSGRVISDYNLTQV